MTKIFENRDGRLVHTQPLVTEYATVGMDGPLLSQSLPMPSLEHLTVLGWLARSYVEIENHAFAMTGKI